MECKQPDRIMLQSLFLLLTLAYIFKKADSDTPFLAVCYTNLQSYQALNQAFASKLGAKSGEVEVYVTFRTYVAADQYREWARTYDLRVEQTQLRFVDEYGLDATIEIVGQPQDPIPSDILDRELNMLTERGRLKSLQGVYFARAMVDTSKLLQLITDPSVYLVDVTPNVVREELKAQNMAGAEQSLVEVVPHSPFWNMEHDLNLVPNARSKK